MALQPIAAPSSQFYPSARQKSQSGCSPDRAVLPALQIFWGANMLASLATDRTSAGQCLWGPTCLSPGTIDGGSRIRCGASPPEVAGLRLYTVGAQGEVQFGLLLQAKQQGMRHVSEGWNTLCKSTAAHSTQVSGWPRPQECTGGAAIWCALFSSWVTTCCRRRIVQGRQASCLPIRLGRHETQRLCCTAFTPRAVQHVEETHKKSGRPKSHIKHPVATTSPPECGCLATKTDNDAEWTLTRPGMDETWKTRSTAPSPEVASNQALQLNTAVSSVASLYTTTLLRCQDDPTPAGAGW